MSLNTSSFVDLGRRIERRWSRAERDTESFADISAEELERTLPVEKVDEIVEAILLTDNATQQLAPAGTFGQPGITVFFGHGFVVDIYFWTNAVPAIHDHPFAGCFTILKGFSLHDRYTFVPDKHFGSRAMIGDLSPSELTILRRGDIVRFSRERYPLIHSLIHVPNPTISLVVRTIDTARYFRYLPPSIAITMAEPDDLSARKIQLITWLQKARDESLYRHAERFISACDFETTFRLISAAWEYGDVSHLIDLARSHHGEIAELIFPSIAAASRRLADNENRERFKTDDDRMVASILMCSHDRNDVFRLLREWFGDRDLFELLDAWCQPDDLASLERSAVSQLIRGEAIDDYWIDTPFRALALAGSHNP